MKHIAILGSTGSIGRSALDVIRRFPLRFRVVALSANSNVETLCQQIKEFHPEIVCIEDKNAVSSLKSKIKFKDIKFLVGEGGLKELVRARRIDRIVLGISGSSALSPLLEAIDNGKDVALANKEALVMAGPIIMQKARLNKISIIPVDSEQSAIWQCLRGEDKDKLRNIYLTASGGPFRQVNKKDFKSISIKQVLTHPRWKMGRKITVDSATLMNKGLEILETMSLFNVDVNKIKVLIHPEAIIHSMVEFRDGVVIAQLSITDMRIPIQYAISYPERLDNDFPSVDFCGLKEFHFQEPDFKKFPCLELAYYAAKEKGTMPAVLNAANEISVDEFLKGRLAFISIPRVIEKVIAKHSNKERPSLKDVLNADVWARDQAYSVIGRLNN